MFWKKSVPTPQEAPPSARSMGIAAEDAALDTVVRLLQSFGEHAFDTDSAPAIDTRSECEGWAQKLSMGEGHSSEGDDKKEFRRDFSGARRYFAAQRASEREYVGRSLGNLREAVQAFARCLTTSVSADRTADQRVGTELGKLVGAFQSNDPAAIRREAESVVSVLEEVMASRAESQARLLEELSHKVNELRAELQEVREKAALDPLTQLYNRASLDAHLDRIADLSFLLASSPCLLMIDVDHFKITNDTYGHAVGDQVLRRVADELVRNFLRREDFVARYGGEEFVVVIPDSSLHNAELRAERVRQSIQELNIAHGSQRVPVSVSIGLAAQASGDTGTSWLARADAALYEAKNAGRNCVRVSREQAPLLSLPPTSKAGTSRSLPPGSRKIA